ncbi:hypothetical protein PRO82_001092 [Candidatus Protochlamydia amoebophila]|nr:hypothetical protein [Candidatus Protochlamydia amoebophila]
MILQNPILANSIAYPLVAVIMITAMHFLVELAMSDALEKIFIVVFITY